MVNYQPIDQTFAVLADPTRRQMVERLLQGDASISELARPHAISMPAAMKHVARLVEAGLVRRHKTGRTVTCSLNVEPMQAAERWLGDNLAAWHARLDGLERYLARNKEEDR